MVLRGAASPIAASSKLTLQVGGGLYGLARVGAPGVTAALTFEHTKKSSPSHNGWRRPGKPHKIVWQLECIYNTSI